MTNRPVLVIDNYDSFVFNLVQYVAEVAPNVVVRRNDAIDLAEVRELDPVAIIISPGPGTPEKAGISVPLFAELDRPILGVCLGHQALCVANGIPVESAPAIVHGKPSVIHHDGRGIFSELPDPLQVGRYHSLAVYSSEVGGLLEETAWTREDSDVVMAVRHRDRPHVGVQFHPESLLTRRQAASDPSSGAQISLETGKRLVRTFYRRARAGREAWP